MKRKVILPFETNSYQITYHYVAFPMGIIQANAKIDLTPWLCGHAINYSFLLEDNGTRLNVGLRDISGMDVGLMFRQTLHMKHTIFEQWGISDYIELIKRMTAQRWYTKGIYNEEHVETKSAYHKYRFEHDYLIIGYDDDEQVFYSAGYVANNQFKIYKIPYDDMNLALNTIRSKKRKFEFYKFNDKAQISYDFNIILSDLSDYIRSERLGMPPRAKKIYGLDAMMMTADYLIYTAENNKYLDIRCTKGIFEHKVLMHLRVVDFLKKGFIYSSELEKAAQDVLKEARIIHLLAIKYLMNPTITLAKKISDKIKHTVTIEREYLPNMLNELKENCGVF